MHWRTKLSFQLSLWIIFGIVETCCESIVGDKPFLSFTNEDSNIGVELGFSIPLLKVPLEGVKRPEDASNILSAPIEVNIPALAVAATMFVASAAFVPKVFQLLIPALRPPPTTEEYWRRDNSSTPFEDLKSLLDLESNSIHEALGITHGYPLSSKSANGRKSTKRFPKPHRLQPSCGNICNATRTSQPLLKKIPKGEMSKSDLNDGK